VNLSCFEVFFEQDSSNSRSKIKVTACQMVAATLKQIRYMYWVLACSVLVSCFDTADWYCIGLAIQYRIVLQKVLPGPIQCRESGSVCIRGLDSGTPKGRAHAHPHA
jgi:hypothetical protein